MSTTVRARELNVGLGTFPRPRSDLPQAERAARMTALRHAAEDYGRLMGWPVMIDEDRVVLKLGGGIAALAMRASLGGEAHHVLTLHQISGPVLALPGTPERWVFLTEAPGVLPRRETLPVEVSFLSTVYGMTLPPSSIDAGNVRWVRPPTLGCRQLPSLCSVLGALRAERALRSEIT